MLTKEQKELVEQNMGLAYYIAHRMTTPFAEFEDVLSLAWIGLTKAAERFDPEAEVKFATYAMVIMQNEILMEFRKMKRRPLAVSLNGLIGGQEKKFCLGDILSDPQDRIGDLEDLICLREDLATTYKRLKGKKKELLILLLREPGKTQNYYASRLGISQTVISRYMRYIRRSLGGGSIGILVLKISRR